VADQSTEVTEQDVVSLKEKLRAFSATLPPGEQVVLGLLLERSTTEAEVQGYGGTGLLTPSVRTSLVQNFYSPGALGSFGLEQRGGLALEQRGGLALELGRRALEA
jgi:hypothetical protein